MSKSSIINFVLLAVICGFAFRSEASLGGSDRDSVPDWNTLSMLYDIPCHDALPEYHFTLTEEFSPQNALILMISSWLGHSEDRELIQEQLRQWGFSRIWLLGIDDKGAAGYIAEHRDFFLLSFRGTESDADLIGNSFFWASAADKIGIPGRIHAGLLQHFGKMMPALDSILDEENRSHKPLIISGHSLGGATAQIAALHRMGRGDRILSLYTFADLRVGDEVFAAYAQQMLQPHYYRIFHDSDLTPQLPPTRTAARQFAELFTDRLPPAREMIYRLAYQLDYGPHAGTPYSFSLGQRTLGHDMRTEGQIEAQFWSGLRAELEGWRDRGNLKAVFQRHIGTHHPYNYICHMLWLGEAGSFP